MSDDDRNQKRTIYHGFRLQERIDIKLRQFCKRERRTLSAGICIILERYLFPKHSRKETGNANG